MNIHIDDGHDSTRVTVGGLAGLTVKVGGYEGIASRVKAPTYQLCEDDGNVVCEVKRHFFSNFPFYTIKFHDGGGSVKLSQEMSAFKICYSIQGNGLSFAGSFERGDIDILQEKRRLGHLTARATDEGVTVDIQESSEEPSITLIGVALAYGLMVAYLRRPLQAASEV